MQIKVLVIGDPHFKVSNTKDTDIMSEAIVKISVDSDPDIIVVLGDVLDRHETIHVSPLKRSVSFLASLMKIAPVYLLIGNHDLKNNRQFLSDEHPFTALKYWDSSRMTVVDTTTIVTINQEKLVFVPYTPPGMFIEALNRLENWKDVTAIFAHQEFKGAQMGPFVSVDGDIWSTSYPHVISGHIHDYQEPQINIWYTGTPIQHSFGDRPDKTISLITFNDGKIENHTRIELPVPKKQIINITCDQVPTYKLPENKELKIVIKGLSGDIKGIIKHPTIDDWKKAGHKIAYKDIPLTISGKDPMIDSKSASKFSTVLFEIVNSKERLSKAYTKLFGSLGKKLDSYSGSNNKLLKLNIKSDTNNK
jgi:DNA repair exonuclease SbcCD nuclease subunit